MEQRFVDHSDFVKLTHGLQILYSYSRHPPIFCTHAFTIHHVFRQP